MIILLADEKDIINYTDQEELKIFDYIKGITKPVTVIYSHAKYLADNVINKDGSIGIRVVKDEFCRQLIRAFGKPIVSTSSNVSGYPPPAYFNDIDINPKKIVLEDGLSFEESCLLLKHFIGEINLKDKDIERLLSYADGHPLTLKIITGLIMINSVTIYK